MARKKKTTTVSDYRKLALAIKAASKKYPLIRNSFMSYNENAEVAYCLLTAAAIELNNGNPLNFTFGSRQILRWISNVVQKQAGIDLGINDKSELKNETCLARHIIYAFDKKFPIDIIVSYVEIYQPEMAKAITDEWGY